MSTQKSNIILNSITLTILLTSSFYGAADGFRIQDANTQKIKKAKWVCKYCPQPASDINELKVSLSKNSDENGRFANRTGDDSDELSAELSAVIDRRLNDKHYRFQTDDLGNNNHSAAVTLAKQDEYNLALSYTHRDRFGYVNGLTPYVKTRSSTLNLPNDWQRVPKTSDMPISQFNNFDNKLKREKWQLSGEKSINESWHSYLDYNHEQKDGTATLSSDILNKIVSLPTKINQKHQQIDAGTYYQYENGTLALNYYHSNFNNEQKQVLWQSPYSPVIGDAQYGQMSTAPSNEFDQISIFSQHQYEQLSLQTRIIYGQSRQDEDFLPYTINPELNVPELNQNSLDGEINNVNAKISARYKTKNKWQFNALYQYNDRDNKTSIDAFQRIITDSVVLTESQNNLPYSFTNKQAKLSAQWRFQPNAKLAFGYENNKKERDFQDRDETENEKVWLKVKAKITPKSRVSFEFIKSDRDGDNYIRFNQKSPVSQSLNMQRYYLADRQRDEVKAQISFEPAIHTQVDIMGHYQRDEYDDTDIGLVKNKTKALDIALSHQWDKHIAISFYVHNQWQDNVSQGSYWYDTIDWLSTQQDKSDSFGVNISADRLLDDKLNVTFDYSYAYAQGDVKVEQFVQNKLQRQNELTLNSQDITLTTSYDFSENLIINLDMLYQKFDEDDWRFNYQINQISNLLGNDFNSYNYDAYRLSSGVTYQF